MSDTQSKNNGLERLIQRYKDRFEIEENINYYAYKDFVRAERKFIKFSLGNSVYSLNSRSN